ncbi:hypothetical protein NDU88_002938 [Pleurodeles waltl]|uniref:Uncharacterized protein n=1 Tax=Pleurodeles waltl TaxID=8319 RepID=A0AAV7UX15_PLEWA|nr:hypothetical protein NDU88_002938 [Pleurodeles waltl]
MVYAPSDNSSPLERSHILLDTFQWEGAEGGGRGARIIAPSPLPIRSALRKAQGQPPLTPMAEVVLRNNWRRVHSFPLPLSLTICRRRCPKLASGFSLCLSSRSHGLISLRPPSWAKMVRGPFVLHGIAASSWDLGSAAVCAFSALVPTIPHRTILGAAGPTGCLGLVNSRRELHARRAASSVACHTPIIF